MIRLITANTVEELIFKRALRKLKLTSSVIEKAGLSGEGSDNPRLVRGASEDMLAKPAGKLVEVLQVTWMSAPPLSEHRSNHTAVLSLFSLASRP